MKKIDEYMKKANKTPRDGGSQFNVAILEGTVGSSVAIRRQEGFKDAMAASPDASKYNILCSQTSELTRQKGQEVMESFLKSYDPKIDILFAHNDDMALGAILLNGREIAPHTPKEAQDLGISTVYQEVNLCPNLTVIIATIVLGYPRFRRAVFAIGGSEQSAALMGLPVFRTKVLVFTTSGFCSALGGIAYSLIMLTGYNLHGLGMEMDAIASSVIGGTLLTGGVAFVPGTLVGVLIQGVILTFISFQGTLSAWWTKIVVGALLCVFIIMQAFITEQKSKLSSKSSMESGKKETGASSGT